MLKSIIGKILGIIGWGLNVALLSHLSVNITMCVVRLYEVEDVLGREYMMQTQYHDILINFTITAQNVREIWEILTTLL